MLSEWAFSLLHSQMIKFKQKFDKIVKRRNTNRRQFIYKKVKSILFMASLVIAYLACKRCKTFYAYLLFQTPQSFKYFRKKLNY